jgi:hypothetical protein
MEWDYTKKAQLEQHIWDVTRRGQININQVKRLAIVR